MRINYIKSTNLNAGRSATSSRASSNTRTRIAIVPKNIAIGLLSGGVCILASTGDGGVVEMFGTATVGSSSATGGIILIIQHLRHFFIFK